MTTNMKKSNRKILVFISKITSVSGISMFWYEVNGVRKVIEGDRKEVGDKRQELINLYQDEQLTAK